MPDIPHAVLSERFQEILEGRRIRCAVFLTFRFEPDFFEQEVLPAVLPDTGFSHVPAIRLLQLEEVLKAGVDHVAVYYDRTGLMPGAQSAKLDVRRIATKHSTGIFHPKNVLLLTEAADPGADGKPVRSLIVATMSANLTRAGWWENVEACHIEEIVEGEPCSYRDDLLDLIRRVKGSCPKDTRHEALEAIRAFVRKLEPRRHRTGKGLLHPRLYAGGQSVVDFLDENVGEAAAGLCLEIISPYFDKHDVAPLRGICERFAPREVRVFLPRADDGSALCDESVYKAARAIAGVHWAQLPAEMVRAGKNDHVKRRTVHSKVYRFFDPKRRYEAFLIGSVNLTSAAHSVGGNLETAFLIETTPKRVPDWWLETDTKKPSTFTGTESEEVSTATTALSIRYDWTSGTATAFWDANKQPGTLEVLAQGAPLLEIPSLRPGQWDVLPTADAEALARILPSTSILEVSESGGPRATMLVQEEGMAHKPSILLTLTAADILRYWALLTAEQRAAFLEERFAEIPDALDQLGIDAPPLGRAKASVFDTFAGIYHAFHALEHSVLGALREGRSKEAEYRLLGKKYDSLPSLLDRVLREDASDPVTQYVTMLCARQLVDRVTDEASDFRAKHPDSFHALEDQLTRVEQVRDRFGFGTPAEREAFLGWFEEWFLTRAEPMEVPA